MAQMLSRLLALGIVSANTVFAAGTFLYYQFRPSHTFPSTFGEDPQILTLGFLFLLAPIGMILGIVAGVHGAPKWLICIMKIASVPLLVDVALWLVPQCEPEITGAKSRFHSLCA